MKITLIFTSLLTLYACKTMQPDYIRNSEGRQIPNIAKCARNNFPEFAKKYVKEAVVDVRIKADKHGVVNSVEPLKVTLAGDVEKKIRDTLISDFKSSAVLSLQGKTCPIMLIDNEPQPYTLVVPLSFEAVGEESTSVSGKAPVDLAGDAIY